MLSALSSFVSFWHTAFIPFFSKYRLNCFQNGSWYMTSNFYIFIKLYDMTHIHWMQCKCFSGEFCDVEILACESSPCHDNSTVECISTPPLKYTCVCVPGYHGDRCDLDINECDSAPCINGGLCIDSTNRYGEFNLKFYVWLIYFDLCNSLAKKFDYQN